MSAATEASYKNNRDLPEQLFGKVFEPPFADASSQHLLELVASEQDTGLEPVFIPREAWESLLPAQGGNNQQSLLIQNFGPKKEVYLPKDIQLGEIPQIIRALDDDTYTEKAWKNPNVAERLREQAENFINAGLYIANYGSQLHRFKPRGENQQQPGQQSLEGETDLQNDDNSEIKQLRHLAEALAVGLYNHGVSLKHETPSNLTIEEIQNQLYSHDGRDDEEIDNLHPNITLEQRLLEGEKWLLGEEAWNWRANRISKQNTPPYSSNTENLSNDDKYAEEVRVRTLYHYLKALTKKGFEGGGKEPWELISGPFQQFQETANQNLTYAAQEPLFELYNSLLRRGVENLIKNLKPGELYLEEAEEKRIAPWERLSEIIQQGRRNLGKKKQINDIEVLSQLELAYINTVIQHIGRRNYEAKISTPISMLENNGYNCFGANHLGLVVILKELGLQSIFVNPPEHAAIIIQTSDEKLHYVDMTPPNEGGLYIVDITGMVKSETGENVDINNIPASGLIAKIEGEREKWVDKIFKLYSSDLILFYHTLIANAAQANEHGNEYIVRAAYGLAQRLGTRNGLVYNNLAGLEPTPELRLPLELKAFAQEPYNADYLANIGRDYYFLRMDEQAEKTLRYGIAMDPNHPYNHFWLGRLMQDLNRDGEAFESFSKLLECDHPRVKDLDLQRIGEMFYNSGQYEYSLPFYQRALDDSDIDQDGYKRLGYNLLSIGNYREALDHFKSAQTEFNNEPWAIIGHADALLHLAEYESALILYNQAEKLEAKNASTTTQGENSHLLQQKAFCYMQLGRTGKAIREYKKALQINPNSAKTYNGLGNIELTSRRFKKAREYFLKSLEISPNYYRAIYNLGLVYIELGEQGNALQTLKKYLALKNDSSDPFNSTAKKLIRELGGELDEGEV